ncbi:hypothetical protein F3087_26150 [Nocardia colli]|uniref:Mce-associated membrane protein n=1 Tax=Nocardia colli TaxID=2545717 RepID=A0A5N0E9J2_9NOCA|nr:hypothetical protein [Nocardia colli]KAA8886092.1 hypothetical protein F3087_26150 [Nocardia colli]
MLTLTKTPESDTAPTTSTRDRSVSIEIPTLIRGAVITVLVLAVVVLSVFLVLARGELADDRAAAADDRHAEQVATDYAVGASTINYADINTWIGKLKANTAPALAGKFDTVGPKMGELLTPLKWTSTATPVAAKVTARNNGVYTVNAFVSLTISNVQNPQAGQVTATYTVTVDQHSGWQITEVGGMNQALPLK